jgi:hypothetical protein
MFLINKNLANEIRGALDFVLDQFPSSQLEIREIHSWMYAQFGSAIEKSTGFASSEEMDFRSEELIKTLSPQRTPSFQEALIIRHIHAELIQQDRISCPHPPTDFLVS